MEHSQFVWVVERIDWEQELEGFEVHWEDRKIMGVFTAIEDARSFVERNAVISHVPYPLKWKGTGKIVYSGQTRDDHVMEGVEYKLHYTALY